MMENFQFGSKIGVSGGICICFLYWFGIYFSISRCSKNFTFASEKRRSLHWTAEEEEEMLKVWIHGHCYCLLSIQIVVLVFPNNVLRFWHLLQIMILVSLNEIFESVLNWQLIQFHLKHCWNYSVSNRAFHLYLILFDSLKSFLHSIRLLISKI